MDVQAGENKGEPNKDDDSDDDVILEFTMDHDHQDQDDDASSNEECIIGEEEEENVVSIRKGHQDANVVLILVLRAYLALDEGWVWPNVRRFQD
eukprot:6368459-Ditylum_brightwellii.AAC.1